MSELLTRNWFKGGHDVGRLLILVEGSRLPSLLACPSEKGRLRTRSAMTSATILMLGSSPFHADSSRCADMSGPSARAAEAINIAAQTPTATLYNLPMPSNYAARES